MSVDKESFEVVCSTMHPHLEYDKNMPYMDKTKEIKQYPIVINMTRCCMKI